MEQERTEGLDRSALLRLWAGAYMEDAAAIEAWQGQSVSLRARRAEAFDWAWSYSEVAKAFHEKNSAAGVLIF